jgi:MFS family permease
MIFLRSPTSDISGITVEKEELQSENFTYQPIDADNLKEQSFWELLLSMDYQLLAILCSSTFAVSLLLSNNLTVLTREEGLSSFDSIITLLYPPLVIITALLFSLISDKAKHRLSRISFINIGGMCLCISSILNAFISTSRTVVVTAVVFGAAGTGIVYTIGPTAMSEMFHIDNFMRNWGLVMLMRAILIIILHVIFGALYDMELKTADAMFCKGLHCTRYGYVVTGGVALVAIGLGICLIVRRNRKIRELIKCFDKHE